MNFTSEPVGLHILLRSLAQLVCTKHHFGFGVVEGEDIVSDLKVAYYVLLCCGRVPDCKILGDGRDLVLVRHN